MALIMRLKEHRSRNATKGELPLFGKLPCLTLCSHRHHLFWRGWSFSAVPLDMFASLFSLSVSLSLAGVVSEGTDG